MSIRLSGVYLVPASGGTNNEESNEKSSANEQENTDHVHQYHHQSKTVTIMTTAPQRSNSLDYLNFEEKRQIIASSLSLSDFLAHGPAAAAAAAKEVAANTVVIAKKQNGAALRTNSLGSGTRTPPLERKSKFSALGRLFKPWKWKRKKKSDKFEATSKSLERKISVRANRDELVQKGILLPESPTSPIPENSLIDSPIMQKPATPQQQQVVQQHQLQQQLYQHQQPGLVAVAASPISQTQQSFQQVQQQQTHPSQHQQSSAASSTVINNLPGNNRTSPHLSPLYPGIPQLMQPNQKNCDPQDEKELLHTVTDEQQVIDQCYSHNLMLSELPEPPIPLSEIGPIPPPPMFSSPSPTFLSRQRHQPIQHLDSEDDDDEDLNSNDEDMYGIDTTRIEEIPAKEPKFHAMPLKSALKKKGNSGNTSGSGTPQNTPTQEMKPLTLRQELHASFNSRPVRFGLSPHNNMENKENTRPYVIHEDSNTETDNGQVLYREDYEDEKNRLAAKIARKQSLSLKLALRPDRQELINRNILQVQSDNERQETKEAIGARLIRRLSMRPTQEELEERNILKKQSPAEEKKQKEEKKRYLLRKLSFRPTVDELKEKKIIRFNDYIEVTQAHDYDRRADKPWTKLTPKDKAAIRKELNEFKSMEMAVHEDSRHLTRFHKP